MSPTTGMVILLLLACLVANTSAHKLFDELEEYDNYKRGHAELGEHDLTNHWDKLYDDHIGEGRGQKLQHHHYISNSGGSTEGKSKARGHLKTHVTKGFENYHHKDEVGKTTHYIDTSGDAGDHFDERVANKKWGDHKHGGAHRDHQASEYAAEREVAKGSFKGGHRGDVADVVHTRQSTYHPKAFYPQVPVQPLPYPYYNY